MLVAQDYYIQLLHYATCRGLAFDEIDTSNDLYLPAEKYLEHFSTFIAASQDSLFGFNMGSFLNLEALGSVYDVSLRVSRIDRALAIWQNYARSNFPFITFEYGKVQDYFFIEIESTVDNPELRRHLLDMVFVFVMRELEIMTNKQKMMLGLPDDAIPYFRKRYTEYEIDTHPGYTLKLDLQHTGLNINQKRTKQIAYVLPAFLNALSIDRFPESSFSYRVRYVILKMASPEIPSVDEVASQFAMTPRTLQRHLKKDATNYRAIADQVREELHGFLAQEQQLNTNEIAHLLGYSSPSAYLHALKRWTSRKT